MGEDQGAQGDHGVLGALGKCSWVPTGPKRAQGYPIDPWVLRCFFESFWLRLFSLSWSLGLRVVRFKLLLVRVSCVVGVAGIGGGVIEYLVVVLVVSYCKSCSCMFGFVCWRLLETICFCSVH